MRLPQSTSSQTEFTIQSFFRRLNEEGKLAGALCNECGARMLPPRPVCSTCLSTNLEWFDAPNEGALVGFSEVHVTNDKFQSSLPYVVAIADLGEGVKIPGIIKDANVKQLRIGDRIKIETRKTSSLGAEGLPAYWFRML